MIDSQNSDATACDRQPLVGLGDWQLGTRLLFRFVFCYSLLLLGSYAAFFAPVTLPLAIVSEAFWQTVMPWVATHVLGLPAPPLNSDGDGLGHWIQMGCWIAIALASTLIWSLLDRRRQNYATLYNWLWVILRYAVGIAMFTYGLGKIVHLQMLPPHLAKLMQPLGDSSPTSLLWIMMGSSAAYSAFTGWAEFLGGILLFNRRTSTFGALISFAAMAQVVALNLSYDVSVKLWSMHLLALTMVLLAPDLRRLMRVLVLNRSSEAVRFPDLFATRRRNRIAFTVGMFCLTITLGFRLLGMLNGRNQSYDRTPVPIYGIYEVEEFSSDGILRPPLLTDANRWRTVVIERSGLASIRFMDNVIADFLTSFDTEKSLVTFVANPDETVTTAGATRLAYNPHLIELRFAEAVESNPDAKIELQFNWLASDQLTLNGNWRGDPIEVNLKRIDETQFLLLRRGLNWVQEYPYFR